MSTDYYASLGLTKEASADAIKEAYRRLQMKYHPDRNPNDSEAERQKKRQLYDAMREAYEVLSDPEKRSVYDRFGKAGLEGAAGPGGGGAGSPFGDIFGNLSDIFEAMSGGGGRASAGGAARGGDLHQTLELSLEEAALGGSHTLSVQAHGPCGPCGGSGAKPGTQPQTCGTCGGYGQVRVRQGFFEMQQTCPKCRGAGKRITDLCRACGGQGVELRQKTLSVQIPAGVDTGDSLRLSGEGSAGVRGAAPGDLYVDVRVRPHTVFNREGVHLHFEVPIRFTLAALGGELEVPTLLGGGRVRIKIPPETQTGRVFRVAGKGMPGMRQNKTGDLLCKVVVETPVGLTEEQKTLLRTFDAGVTEQQACRQMPLAHRWRESVRHFFESIRS